MHPRHGLGLDFAGDNSNRTYIPSSESRYSHADVTRCRCHPIRGSSVCRLRSPRSQKSLDSNQPSLVKKPAPTSRPTLPHQPGSSHRNLRSAFRTVRCSSRSRGIRSGRAFSSKGITILKCVACGHETVRLNRAVGHQRAKWQHKPLHAKIQDGERWWYYCGLLLAERLSG